MSIEELTEEFVSTFMSDRVEEGIEYVMTNPEKAQEQLDRHEEMIKRYYS